MAELYVPLRVLDVRKVIPAGDDILYSTLGKFSASEIVGNKKKNYFWESPLIISTKGIGTELPLVFGDRRLYHRYLRLHRIYPFIHQAKKSLLEAGISICPAADLKSARLNKTAPVANCDR